MAGDYIFVKSQNEVQALDTKRNHISVVGIEVRCSRKTLKCIKRYYRYVIQKMGRRTNPV